MRVLAVFDIRPQVIKTTQAETTLCAEAARPGASVL